jgi:Na+/H+ antiporter NhaD/arsenite permease-like protein
MSLSVIAFLVLVAAFLWGSLTAVNAGLIAIVAAFGVGVLLAGLDVDVVIAQFPGSLFFILVGATLLFSIVRETGTIDLLAAWAERLARGRRALVPVLMFLLTAVLATAGAFTPAAVAIVAPVALALGSRFGISTLAMGLVIVQGANAGAFSPVNPFGVVANTMLESADAADGSLRLYIYCFLFNALLAIGAYLAVQWWIGRKRAADPEPDAAGGATPGASGTVPRATATAVESPALTPVGVGSLLVLTMGFGMDVGVAALAVSLALIAVRPGIQKPAMQNMPWSAILLVTGIVTYVGVLEEMGAITELEMASRGWPTAPWPR